MIIKANFNKLLLMAFGLLIAVSSCKKDPKTTPNPPAPNKGTRAELTKDSIFLYAKETYYWNDQFPTYEVFKPRTFATNQAVLDAIIKLPGTGKPLDASGKPIDKYSFLDDGSVSQQLGGISGDYGFSVFYHDTDGDRNTPTDDLRIKYVSPSSPAATAGLKRGYRITKINNRTDLSTSSDANVNFVSNAVFGTANTVTLTVVRPDNSTQDLTINRATYSNNPIFASKTISTATKKVGYIVYNSFTTNSPSKLREEIGKLYADGATELIVDLRYNGGGSVSTADVFTNLIAPPSVTGQVMYKTYWTKTMQDGKATILSNQPLLDANGKLQPFTDGVNKMYATYADLNYQIRLVSNVDPLKNDNVEIFIKEGSARFNNIYFLVLSGTASASELLINNLKGVMPGNIKLIGQRTYGKPVGFFAIKIDKLDLYIPQFETRNQKDEGGYYDGMTVDYSVSDDVTKDFGDPSEKLLAAALNHAEAGKFAVGNIPNSISSLKGMSVSEAQHLNEILDKDKFKGMVEDKLKFKKK